MILSYKRLSLHVPVCVLRCLKRRMRWVRAAGGIVTDGDGNMLLIRRNGRWDLPKGKVEPGETLLQAAIRETEEETGIKVDSGQWIVGSTQPPMLSTTRYPLPTKTYHIFNLYGGWHLKQTSWFAMTAEHRDGKPQDEEGITEVVWAKPDEWYRRLQTSYGTLRNVSNKVWRQFTT